MLVSTFSIHAYPCGMTLDRWRQFQSCVYVDQCRQTKSVLPKLGGVTECLGVMLVSVTIWQTRLQPSAITSLARVRKPCAAGAIDRYFDRKRREPSLTEPPSILPGSSCKIDFKSLLFSLPLLRHLYCDLQELADVTERSTDKPVNMAVENNVYLAKLAEQAERYEG